MKTFGELVGVLEQMDETGEPMETVASPRALGTHLRTDGGSYAHRRQAAFVEHLLARGRHDGTVETLFTPGYPSVRIDVAIDDGPAGDDRAVVFVDDPDAAVGLQDDIVSVFTRGRERTVQLPFEPERMRTRTVGGRTVVTFG